MYGQQGYGQQGVDPQATWTPVNCNITVATLCTPLCGAAGVSQQGANPQGTFTPIGCTVTPICQTGNTLGPVHCTVAIFCGNAAQGAAATPQGGARQAAYEPATLTPMDCTITGMGACSFLELCDGRRGQQAANPQWTLTPFNCTVTPACFAGAQGGGAQQGGGQVGTPLPSMITPYCSYHCHPAAGQQGGAAATPQGGVNPQATLGPIQCNITIFSICTPICGG